MIVGTASFFDPSEFVMMPAFCAIGPMPSTPFVFEKPACLVTEPM